jgi:putative ABC transport system ATP-binding protein
MSDTGRVISDTGSASMLRAPGLHKEYGREAGLVRAVDGVDLDVAAGETLAVMGPSGCGKSTLLHLLGGLDRPSAGELWADGRRVDQLTERALARLRREAIGFVFQAFHLMDELTAAENVELPALLAGSSPRAARRRALGLLERTGLADRATFLPSALSGGQRQRVAIARALANDPLVVLADEAHRQSRQRGNPGGAAAVRQSACGRADAGHRHARPADRGHRRPADLDARRGIRG